MKRWLLAHWPIGLGVRLGFLAGLAGGLGLLLAQTQFFATALVVGALLILAFADLVRYASAADRDLARVIEAIAQGDLADLPGSLGRHGSDSPVALALARALDRLRQRNAAVEAERSRLTAVIEHAPVALLAVEPDGRVDLLNRAARRLFGHQPPARRADLVAVAPALDAALAGPGGRSLLRLTLPGGGQRFLVSIAHSLVAGRTTALVSLQSIQGELEASEVRAWEELVRVLAHEIMNSLTPVASLAETAALLLGDLAVANDTTAELAEAIDAIHRRSDGLMRFVDGYRRFAEPPSPLKRPVAVAELLERGRRLAASGADAAGVRIATSVEPPGLTIEADADLIDQALLNLLKNAIEAAAGSARSLVTLSGSIDRGGRAVIAVADSGPGLTAELAERVFVPFFTTKPHGSGIGLSIVRQIMQAHGGAVEAVPGDGAEFRLTF